MRSNPTVADEAECANVERTLSMDDHDQGEDDKASGQRHCDS
jgi:hypothetical protein